MKGYIIICSLSLWGVSCLSAQSRLSFGTPGFVLPSGHRGAVNVLIDDERGRLLSAGADGFLEIWNLSHNAAEDRFQLSAYPIHAMVLRPGKSQLSLIEGDGIGVSRISAWDYEVKKKLFTLTFKDTISYINYSAGGNFLIAVQNGRAGVLFIHAETGELLPTPDISGAVSFAATGRSEQTMITYLPLGILSYWDRESGKEIRRFSVPPQIQSPLLLGNNRFLGGIESNGLVILDAVSGTLLIRERLISQGMLLPMSRESSEFICLALTAGYPATFYHFNISNTGRLETKGRWTVSTIPSITSATTSAAFTANTIALGTLDGSVWLGSPNGSAKMMEVRNQQSIVEAAVSGSTLAFLTQEHALGCIPLDYTRLEDREILSLEELPYTQITADPETREGLERFMLWQDEDIRSFPIIRTLRESSAPEDTILNKLTLRFPLRSAALLGEKALFLDALGNMTILSTKTGGVLFSFSSMASLDAAFLDDKNIIVGRSAISGNTPFMIVHSITGETVPLSYPASVGARVYRGASGILYGVALEPYLGTMKTALIRLNTANPSLSTKIVEWEGEDTGFGFTEFKGSPASTLGGEGAFFYDEAGKKPLERSPGLPRRLIDGGNYVIAIDTEGSIGWYDPNSGKLLALFYLYADQWILKKGARGVIRGRVQGG